MQIEKLNDMQVKCTLSSYDLSSRNINILELAYGHEKARALFSEVLQKASYELGFSVGNLPIMVEAIPFPNNSIEIIITKVDEPEEVDTRFSKFSIYNKDTDFNNMNFDNFNVLEGSKTIERPNHNEQLPDADMYQSVFSFSSLDKVIDAARAIGDSYTGKNSLYKHKTKHYYVLSLEAGKQDDMSYYKTCNILTEYGKRLASNYLSTAYYAEHFELISKDYCIQKFSNI